MEVFPDGLQKESLKKGKSQKLILISFSILFYSLYAFNISKNHPTDRQRSLEFLKLR